MLEFSLYSLINNLYEFDLFFFIDDSKFTSKINFKNNKEYSVVDVTKHLPMLFF